jgi:hypothetical protein
MVSTVYLITIALFIGIPVGWVQLTLARWTTPLSAIVGMALFIIGTYAGSAGLMGWGAGLFGWSVFLFVISGAFAKY